MLEIRKEESKLEYGNRKGCKVARKKFILTLLGLI